MARLARRIGDKRLLRIVRCFLQAGMMADGVCIERHEGTPQGGPLSPLLANLLLDDLDKELEHRGHRFCRYADDCNIYVRSQAAGERVMASVSAFLEGKLRLKINRQKSAVAPVGERQFLGHRLGREGSLGIAPKSLARAKDRLRRITRRNRGISLQRMITEANAFTTGWVTYFQHAQCQSTLRDLDGWLRHKLRCVRLKHCKRAKTIADSLQGNGVPEWRAWILALSGKGWWRMAASPPAHEAMPTAWFNTLGLVRLALLHGQGVYLSDAFRESRRKGRASDDPSMAVLADLDSGDLTNGGMHAVVVVPALCQYRLRLPTPPTAAPMPAPCPPPAIAPITAGLMLIWTAFERLVRVWTTPCGRARATTVC